MPEIQGDFEFVQWVKPEQKVGRWRGRFASAPDAVWQKVFDYELSFEQQATGGIAGIARNIDGPTITFDSPDTWAEASASVIRRVAQRTDIRVAQLLEQRRREEEAAGVRAAQLAKELKASEERYKKL